MDRKKLALIHIIKKELGLSDSEYRDTLEKITGVRSAKDLTLKKFKKLINYFVRSKHYRLNDFGLTLKQKYFIRYLAKNLGWGPIHLNNFIQKYYHKRKLEYLNKKEAIKVIESLKHIEKQKKKIRKRPSRKLSKNHS